MALDAFWQETFTATLTPAREGRAAAFGFHPGAETVLAFTRALGRLVSPFHKPESFAGSDLGAVTVELSIALSIARRLTVDLAFADCQRRAFLEWQPWRKNS
jgi:hypothetical protein